MTQQQAAAAGQANTPAPAGDATAHLTTLTPRFKWVFIAVVAFTVAAFIVNTLLVIFLKTPNDQAKSLIDTCSTLVKAGFGAIIGLLGGKAS